MGDDLAWGTQPVSTAATPLQTQPRRLSQNSASLPSVSCDLASGSLTEPWQASQPSTDTPAPPPPPWSQAGPQGGPVLCERCVHTPCTQESAWLDPGPSLTVRSFGSSIDKTGIVMPPASQDRREGA